MSVESTSASYDRWHSGQDVRPGATDPWHRLIVRYLDPTRDLAGRRVIEIGCGQGGFSCWLAGASSPPPNLVAIDYSRVAVDKGRAYATAAGLTSITWETGDIQAIGQPASSFDTAISCETIEHVPDPPRAVRELGRVLKPGGRLFLTSPNYLGPYAFYRAFLRLTGRRFAEVGQPINQFTLLPRTLRWVRAAGLEPEVVDGVGHYLLFPGREPKRLPWLDHRLLKWVAVHGLIVARKPG